MIKEIIICSIIIAVGLIIFWIVYDEYMIKKLSKENLEEKKKTNYYEGEKNGNEKQI